MNDECVINHLDQAYGLKITQVEFLPLGADFNAAVYRVATRDSVPYFLKLRKYNFDEISLLIPQFLHDQGIRQVIPAQKTVEGDLWASLDDYTCILYPYITGRDGFDGPLSDDQWIDFGAALKRIHTAALPPALRAKIPTEIFSPRWREAVRCFQSQVEQDSYADPLSSKVAAFMRTQRDQIQHLVDRAEELASILQAQPQEQVLCHADIHAGNLLLGGDGSLYIVDWDDPILAPKERDLMFIGAGVGGVWNRAREKDLFYQGYGSSDIDLTALTYYRYERIVQDIAAFCERILLTRDNGADREQGYRHFTSQFSPNNVLDIAHRTDRELKAV